MSTNARKMTSASVRGIMQKRNTIPADAVNKRVKFLIQGDGNTVDVRDKAGAPVLSSIPGQEGIILQKKIFNLRSNSALAMANTRTRGYIMNGLKAEKLGPDAKVKGELNGVEGEYTASEWFNAYLNSTQMSFGVLLPSTVADKLASGVEIAATVIRVDTENGSLLTIDPSTISIVEPEVFGTTTFNLEDFAEPATEETPATASAVLGKKAETEA